MVIALVVTPQGFPLAYEVISDKTTLKDFLEQIEAQYGRSDRVWIMDRGIPTEETLEQMRTAQPPVHYLVGNAQGTAIEVRKEVPESALAKPYARRSRQTLGDEELYILARSHPRTLKERAMRLRP